jgi:hypothetical protein
VCLYVCMYILHIIARQRLVKHISAAMNTNATVEELLEPVVFYAVRVTSNEGRIKLSGSKFVNIYHIASSILHDLINVIISNEEHRLEGPSLNSFFQECVTLLRIFLCFSSS